MSHKGKGRKDMFGVNAVAFVYQYLKENGNTPGEDITDKCKEAGIVPHDDRAFGSVYSNLYRGGLIEPKGHVPRRKGHGTGGGKIWGLT